MYNMITIKYNCQQPLPPPLFNKPIAKVPLLLGHNQKNPQQHKVTTEKQKANPRPYKNLKIEFKECKEQSQAPMKSKPKVCLSKPIKPKEA